MITAFNTMADEPPHIRITYNEVHNIIRDASAKIAEWEPDMMVAIGEPSLTLSCHLDAQGLDPGGG